MVQTGLPLLILFGLCLNSQGAVFPPNVYPVFGEEVMLRLDVTSLNQDTCHVITNNNVSYTFGPKDMNELQERLDQKVSYWGGKAEDCDCGVRIRNITHEDVGTWVLISHDVTGTRINGTSFIHLPGSEVEMDEAVESVLLSEDFVLDFKRVMGATINPEYCEIKRPGGQPFLQTFSGNCSVTLPRVTKRELGTWTAVVGLKGMTEEVVYRYTLTGDEWSVNTGVTPSNSSNKDAVNLHCNLQNTKSTVEICRFIRPGDKAAFRLEDHIGSGQYNYYGNGLLLQECGITIERPDTLDYGMWQCLLGVRLSDGSRDTIASYVTLSSGARAALPVSVVKSEPLYVLRNSNATVSCQVDTVLRYCSIISPFGQWFAGSPLRVRLGECSVEVTNFQEKHGGVWTCNMAPEGLDQDLQSSVLVEVLDTSLTAVGRALDVPIGQGATLTCRVFTAPPSITYCRFTRPDGSGYNVNSTTPAVDSRYKYDGRGLAYGDCGLRIDYVNMADHGMWKCSVRSELKEVEMSDFINVTVTGTTDVFPSSVVVDEEEEVVLALRSAQQGQVSCGVVMPDNTAVNLSAPGSHPVSYWGASLQSGECGVKIAVHSLPDTAEYRRDSFQLWKLISVDAKGKETSAVGWVKVTAGSRAARRALSRLEVDLGQTVELGCNSRGSDYCILVPPRGDPTRTLPSACAFTLEPVGSQHLGNWTCIMGFPASTREVVEVVTLAVKVSGLAVGIEQSSYSDSVAKLYCNAGQALSFCRFVSPNATVFVLNDGMVTGRYSFWGDGLAAGYCGIEISGPQPHDFGLWKCSVGLRGHESRENQGGYIVLANEEIIPWASADEELFSLRGSPLTVQCRAETSLLYCWLLHPNGSQLAAVPGHNATGHSYAGAGLEAGDCGLTLLDAQPGDSGVWACHMGTESTAGEELVATVNVTVTETVLASNRSSLEAGDNATVSMGCQAIPVGTRLQYCRWVRPDATAFSPDVVTGQAVLERYWYEGGGLDRGQCGLRIAGVRDVDYGTWTCAALLQGLDREARAHIEIVPEPGLPVGLIVGLTVGLVGMVAVGVVGVLVIRRRRRVGAAETVVSMSEVEGRRQSAASATSSSSSNSNGNAPLMIEM